jgi:hypothetical protein
MRILKYLFIGLLLLVGLVLLYTKVFVDEDAPTIIQGKDPSVMVNKMLEAVNKEAWDSLAYISWSFRDHNFVWDKINNNAIVAWGAYEVHLNPDQIDGIVYKDAKLIEDDKSSIIQKAWSYWCNDMFWLSAPYKARDKDTRLDVAMDSEGKEGLLVTYMTGGVTPGDKYLWYIGDDGLPTGYKMWTKIIPIGGVYTSWEEWKTLEGGSKLSTLHQGSVSFLKISIDNLKAGDSWSDLGYQENPIKL